MSKKEKCQCENNEQELNKEESCNNNMLLQQ